MSLTRRLARVETLAAQRLAGWVESLPDEELQRLGDAGLLPPPLQALWDRVQPRWSADLRAALDAVYGEPPETDPPARQ